MSPNELLMAKSDIIFFIYKFDNNYLFRRLNGSWDIWRLWGRETHSIFVPWNYSDLVWDQQMVSAILDQLKAVQWEIAEIKEVCDKYILSCNETLENILEEMQSDTETASDFYLSIIPLT